MTSYSWWNHEPQSWKRQSLNILCTRWSSAWKENVSFSIGRCPSCKTRGCSFSKNPLGGVYSQLRNCHNNSFSPSLNQHSALGRLIQRLHGEDVGKSWERCVDHVVACLVSAAWDPAPLLAADQPQTVCEGHFSLGSLSLAWAVGNWKAPLEPLSTAVMCRKKMSCCKWKLE